MIDAGSSLRRALRAGPLDPDFWLGDIDARLPALFRMGLGIVLLGDALLTLPHVSELYGPHGVWPAAEASGPLAGFSDSAMLGVWVVGCLAFAALAVGCCSRLSALVGFVFLVSVHQRNLGVATGGDFWAQILLFFCVWLDTGAAYSVDARWWRRPRDFVSAGPWRAMQLHLALMYFATARLKLHGDWGGGDGLYLSLQLLGFLRPPGVLLLQHPALCRLLNWAVLGLEGAFAFFALSPLWGRRARWGAVICDVLVQGGILMTMRVGMFTPLMLLCALLFVPGKEAPRVVAPFASRVRPLLAFAPVAVAVLVAWGAFVGRRIPLPVALTRGVERIGLSQPYQLFGKGFEVAEWDESGRDTQGREHELLREAAPGLLSEIHWSYSPLYKLTFTQGLLPAPIARWVCHEYERDTGTQLASVTLWKDTHAPRLPGQSTPVQRVTLYSGSCGP